MIRKSQVQEITASIGQKPELLTKVSIPLDEFQTKKKEGMVMRWLLDKDSKLYCQWFVE
jgi:hypothetical protein